jgi:hypothetical protein
VFLLAVPVMLLLLLVGPRLLPEPPSSTSSRFDLLSLASVLALAVVFGLKQIIAAGHSGVALSSIAAGLALGAIFIRRQRRPDPLLDLSLLARGPFSAALATNVVALFVIFGMSLFLAQYLQSVLGLSPLAAGAWSVPEALGFIVGSMATPRLAGRHGAGTVVAAGLLLGGLGWGIVATTGGGLFTLVTGSMLGAIGLAAVVTLVTDLAVSAAPASRAGAASAMSETSSELGGALGIAILGSIGAAIYRAASRPTRRLAPTRRSLARCASAAPRPRPSLRWRAAPSCTPSTSPRCSQPCSSSSPPRPPRPSFVVVAKAAKRSRSPSTPEAGITGWPSGARRPPGPLRRMSRLAGRRRSTAYQPALRRFCVARPMFGRRAQAPAPSRERHPQASRLRTPVGHARRHRRDEPSLRDRSDRLGVSRHAGVAPLTIARTVDASPMGGCQQQGGNHGINVRDASGEGPEVPAR